MTIDNQPGKEIVLEPEAFVRGMQDDSLPRSRVEIIDQEGHEMVKLIIGGTSQVLPPQIAAQGSIKKR